MNKKQILFSLTVDEPRATESKEKEYP